jgi:LPS export ABC transporter protein LptC
MLRRLAQGCALAVLATAGCTHASNTAAATPGPAASAPPATAGPTPSPLPITVNAQGNRPVRLTEFKRGRVLYVLLADAVHARYVGPETGTSTMVNPQITFYQPHGKRLYATAPAGTVVEKDKTMLMTGGVHAHSEDGMTLRSDTLRYDDRSEVVHGEGHVVVTSPGGERLDGNTIDWNLQTGDVQMSSTPLALRPAGVADAASSSNISSSGTAAVPSSTK